MSASDINNSALLAGLAGAVQFHLSYLCTVSRTDLLAESCFRNSVVEYLERIPTEKCAISFEHRHPVFKSKRIDIAWKLGMNNPEKLDAFLEMKFVKSATANDQEKERYFNDLTRLAFLTSHDKNGNPSYRGFFLASGRTLNWRDCFLYQYDSQEVDGQGAIPLSNTIQREAKKQSVYAKWLSFDINKSIKVVDTRDYSDSFYEKFCKEYELRSSEKRPDFFIKFRTELLWINGLEEGLTGPTVTALWEVTAINDDE